MSKRDFILYLTQTLIPDLRESGRDATAADFEAAVLFMQGATEVEIVCDDEFENNTAIKVK